MRLGSPVFFGAGTEEACHGFTLRVLPSGQTAGRLLTAGSTLFTVLLWLQGLYYLVTGLWPLVSIQTFQMVSGPKTDNLPTGSELDHWLVMTAGVLITAIAVTLLTAAWRRRHPVEVVVLALGAAVALTTIDVLYVGRHVISPIYLLDAGIEVVLILGWLVSLALSEPEV